MKGRGIGTARGRATIMRGTLQLSSSVRTFLLMYASFFIANGTSICIVCFYNLISDILCSQ